MTLSPLGPGKPYQLLFDDDNSAGRSLPEPFRAIYGSDWRMPPAGERPYTFINFVASRDGKVSFNEAGRDGGGDISLHARHDGWLMGLIRARADAILVGATTLRASMRHHWLPETVFRDDATAYTALREQEGRSPTPLLVLVTRSGELPAEAVVLTEPRQQVLIATSQRGAERARQLVAERPQVSYHISPGNEVDLTALVRALRSEHKVADLLSEGGAAIYGALLQARILDDEFLTVSPIVVGNPPPPALPRTSLVEGVAFPPDSPPRVDLLSLRRHESYLFQRARYRH